MPTLRNDKAMTLHFLGYTYGKIADYANKHNVSMNESIEKLYDEEEQNTKFKNAVAQAKNFIPI